MTQPSAYNVRAEIATEEVALLIEGEDYYMEGEFMVFTAAFLRKRGYCCDSGCRYCPWRDSPDSGQNGEQNQDKSSELNDPK